MGGGQGVAEGGGWRGGGSDDVWGWGGESCGLVAGWEAAGIHLQSPRECGTVAAEHSGFRRTAAGNHRTEVFEADDAFAYEVARLRWPAFFSACFGDGRRRTFSCAGGRLDSCG